MRKTGRIFSAGPVETEQGVMGLNEKRDRCRPHLASLPASSVAVTLALHLPWGQHLTYNTATLHGLPAAIQCHWEGASFDWGPKRCQVWKSSRRRFTLLHPKHHAVALVQANSRWYIDISHQEQLLKSTSQSISVSYLWEICQGKQESNAMTATSLPFPSVFLTSSSSSYVQNMPCSCS